MEGSIEMSCTKRQTRIFAAVLMLLAVMLVLNPLRSAAESSQAESEAKLDYIGSWEEYIEAGGVNDCWEDKANAIDDVIEASINNYKAGNTDEAYNAALVIYNFYYETSGFERNVNGYSGSEVSKAELQFKICRKAVKKGEDTSAVISNFMELSRILHGQANYLDGVDEEGVSAFDEEGNRVQAAASSDEGETKERRKTSSSASVTFFSCFGIILREGLEAILVVGAIIAYLVKSGNRDKLKAVYAGCVLAIICSFVCAWLLQQLKLANTANQEIIEGVTALIAVVVLFYVSNWMVSKAEAEAWTKYIDGQVKASAETGSVFTLGFTAFLAVFREGAEVILFYQPLISDEKSVKYMWAGFGTGCVVLAVVFLIIRFFSVKLPIRPFFLGTSILMFIMSVSFLGSGIKELIEGDVIDATSPEWLTSIIPYNDILNVLGVYPVLQTLIPQLILILITVTIFVIQKWNRNSHVECGIIAVIFGSIGLHKFYRGQYGRGILYIIFCWSFIPAFVGVLEGIHYLTEGQAAYEEELKPKPKKQKEKKQKAAKES